MKHWPAYRSPGFWAGVVALGLVLLLLAAAGLQLGLALYAGPQAWQVDQHSFWLVALLLGCLVLAAVLLYRLSSAWSMAYALDRNAVFVTWLGNRWVIPMDRIESIDIGVQGARLPWFGLRSFGYRRGVGRLTDGRPLHLFATAPLGECLLLYTAEAAYALSPAARGEFIQELEQRRGLGAVQPLREGIERSNRLSYPFWTDEMARRLLIGALLLNLLLWGVLSWGYPGLPELVLLRLDAAGGHLQPKYRLLLLPLGALGLTLVNLLLGLRLQLQERGAALLMQGASVLVHLLALAALLALLR